MPDAGAASEAGSSPISGSVRERIDSSRRRAFAAPGAALDHRRHKQAVAEQVLVIGVLAELGPRMGIGLIAIGQLRRRFAGHSLPWFRLLESGFARLVDLGRQKRFDARIVYCELFPLMPGWIERALLPVHRKSTL